MEQDRKKTKTTKTTPYVRKLQKRKRNSKTFLGNYGLTLLMIILLILAASCLLLRLPYFKANHELKTIVRDLKFEYFFFENDPVERDIAWDQELPSIVEQDLAYAKTHGYNIVYTFGEVEININPDKEFELFLHIDSPYYTSYGYDSASNFSIYRDEKNIVVYGYDSLDWFKKITISKEDYDYETLTYDSNLPFSMYKKSMDSYRLDEYSIIIEDNKKFVFYKNGFIVSSQDFPNGTIQKAYLSNSYIINSANEVYMLFVEMNNNKPYLRFAYIDTVDVDSNSSWKYDSISLVTNHESEEPFHATIFTKNDKEYALIPNDLKTYQYASLDLKTFETFVGDPDYSAKLIPLKENMKKITFNYTNDSTNLVAYWNYTITYTLSGRQYIEYGYVHGYDDEFTLPENVAKKFEKTVTTWEAFWENVEAIRQEYFNYYDHGES